MKKPFKRIALIVLDSVGIGEMPDAADFGDKGAHTLGHISEKANAFSLPNLEKFGLGNIAPLSRVPETQNPLGFFGKMAEQSASKDTMTGHWELMGLHTQTPFRVFPEGFPKELLDQISMKFGRGILGNKPASGTEILVELGEEHIRSSSLIVYTSADSVFQIAAHEEIVPLSELYEICHFVREITREDPYKIGRVIARPFVGTCANDFKRTSNRHDYALKPEPTVLSALKDSDLDVISVGKIVDIFDGEGITRALRTVSNDDGVIKTIEVLRTSFEGLLFTNLVDFDALYGHRRDIDGYARALMQFDAQLPAIMQEIGEDDLLILTADHGNDPSMPGTDHTREYVPLLIYSPYFAEGSNLGILNSFADVGATILDNFEVDQDKALIGTSFLDRFI
jgi:phosphopentomutase